MAATTSPLSQRVSNYEKVLNALDQERDKYNFNSSVAIGALLTLQNSSKDSQSQAALSNLANRSFFFAAKTFEKVFTSNEPIGKIKNLALVSAVLTQTPGVAEKVFPGIQIAPFDTKEGLEQLRDNLKNREDYKTFEQTEWANYQSLKAAKKVAKDGLVSLIKTEHISRASLGQHTKNKKIVRLGFKEGSQ
ncbi:MAG TPA: hypothetical protein VHK67_06635 [Rhabdochlamydiaceae bacterium]|jgi:hypothetical protein|nr:hypothetical protein [Rhabdochlamydiaceae bacterium]